MIQFHNKTLRENALKATMNKNKENDIEEEDEEDDIDFFLKEDEEMRKLNMYKDLLGILSKKYEYKIVNTTKTLIEIDEEANNMRGEEKLISTKGSKVRVYVVPTNEELMIARATQNLIK
jgi:acetate kinase